LEKGKGRDLNSQYSRDLQVEGKDC
jgi:hypothetical protein